MAFCPHCGKQVTEQASKCIACGKEIQGKGGAARFKGTMMMTPAAVAPAPEPAPEPVPPKPAPAPAAPAPAAAPAPVAAAAAPRPSKMKATMLGTGGAGLAPPVKAMPGGGTVPLAPPPAAGSRAPAPVAEAAAAPPPSDPALADTGKQSADSARAAASAPAEREDSQRFLVGDPMAPAGGGSARRGSREAEDQIPTQRTGMLLAIGLGGLLMIAAVGYFTARFMGLL